MQKLLKNQTDRQKSGKCQFWQCRQILVKSLRLKNNVLTGPKTSKNGLKLNHNKVKRIPNYQSQLSISKFVAKTRFWPVKKLVKSLKSSIEESKIGLNCYQNKVSKFSKFVDKTQNAPKIPWNNLNFCPVEIPVKSQKSRQISKTWPKQTFFTQFPVYITSRQFPKRPIKYPKNYCLPSKILSKIFTVSSYKNSKFFISCFDLTNFCSFPNLLFTCWSLFHICGLMLQVLWIAPPRSARPLRWEGLFRRGPAL